MMPMPNQQTPSNTQSDHILEKQEDKIMAGFSYMDSQSSLLFEAGVNVDSIYPPSMNINVTKFTNGAKDSANKLWINVKIGDFINLYNNMMDPSTYGIVEISFNSKNGGPTSVHIGLQPNGQLYVDDGRTSYSLVFDDATRTAFASYILEWHLHGAVYKDVVENIRNSLNKSISCMMMDIAGQLNMQLTPPKTYETNTGTGGNRGGYNRQQNNRQSNQGLAIGGNGQYRAPAPRQQNIPQAPSIPQMPIPNRAANVGDAVIPPTQQRIPQQQPMGGGIPQMPKMPPIQQMPTAPNVGNMPQQPIQQSIPQQPQQGIPMGIPIPQTPAAAGNGINADLGKLINNGFGGIPSGLQQ